MSAPLRTRAFDVAVTALHRALIAAGETSIGFSGSFELRAVE